MIVPAVSFQTRTSLGENLERLGVRTGDMIKVHAAMTSYGVPRYNAKVNATEPATFASRRPLTRTSSMTLC
jgi:hypothetical protein